MNWDACWLSDTEVPEALGTPTEVAAWELAQAGIHCALRLCPEMGDAFEVTGDERGARLCGGETGLLYGAYRLVMRARLGEPMPAGIQKPAHALRMLNHWDNMDGTVERGYAGESLFFCERGLRDNAPRLRGYARLLSSVGVNVVCINNVNVSEAARALIDDALLPGMGALARLFGAFGIRLMLAVDYAMPTACGLPTADPLDAGVQAWWQERVAQVYQHVPNLCGFLVKADSEHRPGPYTYGRNHAQGANLLARALQPYGGVLVWRCFVYNCKQDWRDTATDRPKAAYDHYAALDGEFEENVLLQIKHGPFDFQVREPLSPLLLAMPRTGKAVEWQLAQEYTGQQIDLYAMQGMWNEVLADMPASGIQAMAAVANTGMDPFWTGHPFAQLNLFAYGLMAWEPRQSFECVTRRLVSLTYALQGRDQQTLVDLLLLSRGVYEKYTAPLGLCWMVNPGHHYGPSPMGYEYSPWGTYHRADRDAVGVNRTQAGTGYLQQYPPSLQARYADPATCPETLLLFFHRLRYDFRMRDGRTLIQRIYDDHFEGEGEAALLANSLRSLQAALPEAVYREASARMERQRRNAREWRDVLCDFFHRLSGIADEKGRL